jgi:hypothetical protein
MVRRKSTALVPNMIRMREELRKRLEQQAKKNDRSLNSEMVARLEKSFVQDRDAMILDTLLVAMTSRADDDSEFAKRIQPLSPVIKLLRDDPDMFLAMAQASALEESSANEGASAKEEAAPIEKAPPPDEPTG